MEGESFRTIDGQGAIAARAPIDAALLVSAPRTRVNIIGLMLLAAFAVTLPMWMVTIPPLVDAPGHLARISIALQQAADPSVMANYVSMEPKLLPNMGMDAAVAFLAPWVGAQRAFWFVTLMISVLMVGAMMLVVRAWNRAGASGAGWALMLVWSSPFLWGFLSYWLSVALAVAGFALWKLMEDRPGRREMLFWMAIPVTFLAHAVGGCLMVMLIGAWELGRVAKPLAYRPGPIATTLFTQCRPLFVILPLIAWWLLSGYNNGGSDNGVGTLWSFTSKFEELGTILRDQNMVLDIASVVATIGVIAVGWWKGARFVKGAAWPIAAVWIAYFILPFTSAGGSYLDMRLVPVGLMLMLLLQDWRGARAPWLAKAVLAAGFALFALRLGITTYAFAEYERGNRSTLSALNHVERGSRIMAFAGRSCHAWQHPRYSHLPSLAVHYRQAWVNSLWDVDGLHTLKILYRPSDLFYHDPSQHVWGSDCDVRGDRITQDQGGRPLSQALGMLPAGGYDYLWLLGNRLTPDQAADRFAIVWDDDHGALYRRLDVPVDSPARSR